ncbi:MAG: DbpA RNA binding domain-containing protein [Methylococcales bacterium]|nr:DbpA RNA binding domain-containing protein [Methylococcales bacterium]
MTEQLEASERTVACALLQLCLHQLSQSTALPQTPKLRRYRLEVGQVHGVTRGQIEQMLVEEAGVDRRWLSFIDIRDSWTLVDLPEGMPGDIFAHLQTVELNGQALAIHRHQKTQSRQRRSRARTAGVRKRPAKS